jgi:molecular chaperone GrpE
LGDDGAPKRSDQDEKGITPATEGSNEGAELPEAVGEPSPEVGPAEEYHRRARLAEDRLDEVLSAYRKLKADNERYRQRTTRTIERQFQQRHDAILLKFIDVMDNLDRALEATQTSAVSAPLVEGLLLVRTQILQILKDEGLERVPVLGLPYDPHVSEAMGVEPVDDADHHHIVVKELLRGYKLNGRVARASRVVLGEYAEAPPSPPPVAETVEKEPERVDDEPSLEEIIARVESQEALFPAAFKEEKTDAAGEPDEEEAGPPEDDEEPK